MNAASFRPAREIFGFALASSLNDPSFGYPSWNFSLLSTVAFFGLHVNSGGAVISDSDWAVWNSSALTGLVTKAHVHATKVVLTIILQDFQPGTPSMCAGLINRATTVSQIVGQVKAKGVDGVNVDYEGLNGTCRNGLTSRSMMTDFIRELRSTLLRGSYLSVDTYASSAADSIGFFDVRGMSAFVDSFFVMAYDLEYSNWRHAPLGCSSFCLGPTAPLSGYYYNDINTARQYLAAVPATKVILGVPYYGRKSCVSSAAPNQYPSNVVGADSFVTARDESTATAIRAGSYLVHRDAHDPGGHERWDTWYNTALNCTRELYWDDTVSLGAKYDLVNAHSLRGVGIWNLNYGGGAPELWSALATHFGTCSSVSVTVNPASPARVGTSVTVTAAALGCPDPSPQYEFWTLAPGSSAWQLAQAYSASPTFSWRTGALRAGTYRFSVFVHDASGPGASTGALGRYDAFNATELFTLTSIPCTAVSVSSSPTVAMVGAHVSITARATGCPDAMYQFWVLDPVSGTWQVAQSYGASTALDWSTAGKPPGRYRFSVFVRDVTSIGVHSGSLGGYDAFNASRYATLTPGCVAVHASAAPSGSVPVGTVVAIGGTASGCLSASPLYAFWVLPPGAVGWQLVRGYSTSSTFNWASAGRQVGSYRFSVWVHDPSNSGVFTTTLGPYDAFDASLNVKVSPSCGAVTVGASPRAPVVVGTRVTISASASGCPHPLYEFWILNPGSSTWHLARPYVVSPTFAWSTTGESHGTYRFSVWVHDASTSGLFSNSLGRYDASNPGLYFTLR